MQSKTIEFNGWKLDTIEHEDELYIDVRQLFSKIFLQAGRYVAKLKEVGRLTNVKNQREFFHISEVYKVVNSYRVHKRTYQRAPEKYTGYISFVEAGGIQGIVEIAARAHIGLSYEDNYQPPALDYLKAQNAPQGLKMAKKEDNAESRVIAGLRSKDIFLWSTVLVILCMIPFTVLAILKYITIGEDGAGLWLSYIMAFGLAVSIDWSILVFTLNGKEKLAAIGSVFQVIFVSIHFGLIADLFGPGIEASITKMCVILYSAILINQYSKLCNVK